MALITLGAGSFPLPPPLISKLTRPQEVYKTIVTAQVRHRGGVTD
jgi:hypothetical protein